MPNEVMPASPSVIQAVQQVVRNMVFTVIPDHVPNEETKNNIKIHINQLVNDALTYTPAYLRTPTLFVMIAGAMCGSMCTMSIFMTPQQCEELRRQLERLLSAG